jgi:hypothetical protein
MEILDAGSDYAVAAYDASTETLVIVAVVCERFLFGLQSMLI